MLKMMLLAIGRHVESRSELTIKDMLSNSIVKAMMEADGINPQVLEAELSRVARQISTRRVCLQRFPVAHERRNCRLAIEATPSVVTLTQGDTLMLVLLAENLKLILVFLIVAAIVGLSYFS